MRESQSPVWDLSELFNQISLSDNPICVTKFDTKLFWTCYNDNILFTRSEREKKETFFLSAIFILDTPQKF